MKIFALISFLAFSGCALRAVQTKSIVIPPSNEHTVVTIKGTGISTDYILYRTAAIQLEVETKNGQNKTESVK